MSDFAEILNMQNDPALQKVIAKRPLNTNYIADYIMPPVQLSQAGGMINYELTDEGLPDEVESLMTSRSEGTSYTQLQTNLAYGTVNRKRTARLLYDQIKACQSSTNPGASLLERKARALGLVKEWFARLKEKQVKDIVDANFSATVTNHVPVDGRTIMASAAWTTTDASGAQIILDIIRALAYGVKKNGRYIKKAFCPEPIAQIAQAAIGNKLTLQTFENMLLTKDLESTWNNFTMFGLTIKGAAPRYRAAGSSDYSLMWDKNYFYLVDSDDNPTADYAYPTFGWTGYFPDARATDNYFVVEKNAGINWEADVVTNWGHTIINRDSLIRITGPESNGAVSDLAVSLA